MEYYLGLIPSQNSFEKIYAIRENIIKKYKIDDYRKKPIFHVTIAYLNSRNINDLINLLVKYDLNKLYLSKPIKLNIMRTKWWKNEKIVFTLDNTPLIAMVINIEEITKKYNMNQAYRQQIKQFSSDDLEDIGDHLKLIRNINECTWDEIKSSRILKTIKHIEFDKFCIFTADYSECIIL